MYEGCVQRYVRVMIDEYLVSLEVRPCRKNEAHPDTELLAYEKGDKFATLTPSEIACHR